MKLLFDENLSFRLVAILADLYPGSAHLRDVGLAGAADERVWLFAREHGFVLTSKDSDFYHRSILRGAPPKVIWLKVRNASTDAIAELLRREHSVVLRFGEDEFAAFLILGESS